MLEIAVAGVPGAGGEGARAVADLDQVAKLPARLITVGLVPVVAVVGRHGLDVHLERVWRAGQREDPRPVAAIRPGPARRGEGGALVATVARRRWPRRCWSRWYWPRWYWPRWSLAALATVFRGLHGRAAAVPDGITVIVDDCHAELAVRVAGAGPGQVADLAGVEGAEAVCLPGPLGQPLQGAQREGQVPPHRQPEPQPTGPAARRARLVAGVAGNTAAGSTAGGTA
jgi:hypothetical protein